MNNHLFNTLKNVADFIALESDMEEIKVAIEQDKNQLNKYSEMEMRAMQWISETDTFQFSLCELLVIFACSELKLKLEKNN